MYAFNVSMASCSTLFLKGLVAESGKQAVKRGGYEVTLS